MNRWLLTLAVCLLGPVSTPSHGWIIDNWWADDANIVMDLTFGFGSIWSLHTENQMAAWNHIDTTDYSHPFRVTLEPQMTFGGNDGVNSIGFLGEAELNATYGLSYANVLAWATRWAGPDGRYDECDVMINPDVAWVDQPSEGSWFQSTVKHELGHCRGLLHSNTLSMMKTETSHYLRGILLYMDDRDAIRQNATTVPERDITIYNKWHDGSDFRWMTMAPTVLREGQTVNLYNITVENPGSMAFDGPVRLGVYVSDDLVIDTSDELVHIAQYPSFPTFSFSTFDLLGVPLPPVETCTEFYIGGMIDDVGAWAERYEFNNSVVFTSGLPYIGSTYAPTKLIVDLAVDAHEPNNLFEQAPLLELPISEASLTIDRNSEVDLYRIEPDQTGSLTVTAEFDRALGDIGLWLYDAQGNLLVKATSQTDDETLTWQVDPGTYYIHVGGTCNRYALHANLVTDGPDLTVRTVSGPAHVVIGERIDVHHAVRNDGDGSSGAFTTGLYISDDPICTTADGLLATHDALPLNPGEEHSIISPVYIPGGEPVGPKYFCVYADDAFEVIEPDESNNTGYFPIELQYPPEFVAEPAGGATLDFGDQNLSQASPALEVAVSNPGEGALRLSCSVSGLNAGAFEILECPAAIEPEGSAAVSVRCTPDALGPLTATLKVESNDPAEPELSYSLQCNGVTPPLFEDGFEALP